MFIANEYNVEIKLNGDPMVTGTRRRERYSDLWKMPLPPADKFLRNNNEIYDLRLNNDE